MGHANIQTTVDRYGHLIEALDAQEYGAAMIAGLISDAENAGPARNFKVADLQFVSRHLNARDFSNL